MKRSGYVEWRFLLVGLLLWPQPVAAVELRPVKVATGTKGLISAPAVIVNTGGEPLACTAQLAHWYARVVGMAAPGAAARIDLWFDPVTGTYLILNDKQENMPVESLWCGVVGRAYETRAMINLDRRIGANAATREISCAASADRLVCK